MKLSELYPKYPHLLVLHGIMQTGALDNAKRSLVDRYNYCCNNREVAFFSCHVMWHKHCFTNWGDTGLIFADGIIKAAYLGDGGTDPQLQCPTMEDSEIFNVLNNITPQLLCENYIELVVVQPIFWGAYFIEQGVRCFSKEEVENFASLFSNLLKINFKNGEIDKINFCNHSWESLKDLSTLHS